MVAITVILAAVIGSFVLNLGGSLGNSAPQANFEFDYNQSSSTVIITHTSGDSLESSSLDITESGSTDNLTVSATGSVTAGTEIASGIYDNGETIRVVWESDDGENSATLGESTAP